MHIIRTHLNRSEQPCFDALTPAERTLEMRALEEERSKLAWLRDTPAQLTRRIPNSVFALGGSEATGARFAGGTPV